MLLVIIIGNASAKVATLVSAEAIVWLVDCIVCEGAMLACNILCILD